MPRIPVLPRDDDAEAFLIMALMPAMAEGRSLIVEGAVSDQLLSNLAEFSAAWHNLDASKFKPIEIHSSERLPNNLSQNRSTAVAAFSGGVDSLFTVWRHTQRLAGHRTQNIRYCAMIHGYDYLVNFTDAFQLAFDRASAALKTLDVPLQLLRTNFREVFPKNFALYQGAVLAACLQLFKGECSVGLVASTRPYNNFFMPWGTNPTTDPLLSTQGFEIQHDSAGVTRLEKVVAISGWQAGCDNLRVCLVAAFEGDAARLNCGKCQKCIRTILEFQTCGFPVPRAFAGPLTARQILNFRIHHSVLWYWRELLKNAVRKKNPPALVLAIFMNLAISSLVWQVKRFLIWLGIWQRIYKSHR